ncbi:MarR family winged helix-turn-helix transcriptional regulator [Microvirga vignae]|uniref:MarR family winged helix-turn-helix transcriptional regulator n=1 Tax=Microvirga vignae TaxID=1225564 RepID=UPI000A8928E2|nr:MarR family transcriptional regulator [Microvirga vignae]
MHDDVPLEITCYILDHCLGLHLQRAARVVARRLDEALRPLDLTNGQFELLALLRQTPAQGIASVAERLGRDRTTITAILKPLKQRGLVAVTVNPDDSRGRRLSLTRAGRDLLAAAIPHWGRFHLRMDHLFANDEVDLLRRSLTTLSRI